MRRTRTIHAVCVLTIVALAIWAPDYILSVVGTAILSGLFAAASDLLIGVAGILSLGSAVFFGIGAYAVALTTHAGLPFVAGLAAGVVLACLLGVLAGAAALTARQESVPFALLMLIASLAAEQVIISGYGWSGGSNGIAGIAPPRTGGPAGLGVYFALIGLASIALLAGLRRIAAGPFGTLLRLQAQDAKLAEALGFHVKHAKVVAITISAAAAASAGGLYVPLIGIAYPAMFGVLPNMLVLVWIALGGAGTLIGPATAALVMTLLRFELGSRLVEWYDWLCGIVLVAAVIWAPGGVWRLPRRTAPGQ